MLYRPMLTWLMVGALFTALAGCGNSPPPKPAPDPSTPPVETSKPNIKGKEVQLPP